MTIDPRGADIPAPADYLRRERLRGSVMDMVVDERGNVIGSQLVTCDAALPASDCVGDTTHLVLVVPEQPVGAGARWDLDVRQGTNRTRTTVTLEAHEGDRLKLSTSFAHLDGVTHVDGTGTASYEIAIGPPTTMWITHREHVHFTVDGVTVAREAVITSTPHEPPASR